MLTNPQKFLDQDQEADNGQITTSSSLSRDISPVNVSRRSKLAESSRQVANSQRDRCQVKHKLFGRVNERTQLMTGALTIRYNQPVSRPAGSISSCDPRQLYHNHHVRIASDQIVLSACAEPCQSCDELVYPRVLQTPASLQSAAETRPCSSWKHKRISLVRETLTTLTA